MTKKVFNLSIKELKDIIGIFDKKKKKRRRKRNKKSIINKTNNVRSTSEHMMIPTNVSTLQSENLYLMNRQLENKIEQDKETEEEDLS